jgi:hypothetical protein
MCNAIIEKINLIQLKTVATETPYDSNIKFSHLKSNPKHNRTSFHVFIKYFFFLLLLL